MKTDDLIQEIQSLPVEERARVADLVLKSLNRADSEIDKKWAELSMQRLHEIKTGRVKPVPGEDVFDEVWKRFS
jgi:putative addiction module component (TIGR02574 family)